MKEQILKLRKAGLSYNQIVQKLGCSKGTIAYHCNNTTKGLALERQRRTRKGDLKTIIGVKLEKIVRRKGHDFRRRDNGSNRLDIAEKTFTTAELVEKLVNHPYCYLTGEAIDLFATGSYHLDHKTPIGKGGSRSLDNLGAATKGANIAKGDMTVDEFLYFCERILLQHGYYVKKMNIVL